jgi:hypothetical protein
MLKKWMAARKAGRQPLVRNRTNDEKIGSIKIAGVFLQVLFPFLFCWDVGLKQ